jgi:glycosyltransferase involved in cell wall biosynthesis
MSATPGPESPFVSVVMPIRNESAFIGRSLTAVLAQDYPAERFEVIVADGCSTDGTRETVVAMARQDDRVRVLENSGRIVATGLNQALEMAKGDIIVRVDGHCEIAGDYVRRCVAHLADGDADGVGGPLETIGETPVAQAIAAAMSSRFGVGDSAFRTTATRSVRVDTIAFPAYTRRIVERAGPFDVELVRNQDDEYNYRLRKLGGRLLLAPDVRSRYYSRSSLRSLCRQYFQYGYWKVRVLQKHPRQMRRRQFIPPMFVAALTGSAVAAPWLGTGPVFVLIAGMYLAANAAASVTTAVRIRSTAALPYLPLTFGILHLSYGCGFLVGAVKFFDRWWTRDATGSESSQDTARQGVNL